MKSAAAAALFMLFYFEVALSHSRAFTNASIQGDTWSALREPGYKGHCQGSSERSR